MKLRQSDDVVNKLIEHQKYAPAKPKLPFHLFEQSSVEAMFSDLAEHIPNGCLSSSEGQNILKSRLMSKTSILNSLYSGDAVTVNSKVDGSTTLEDARLTVNIMVQKKPLERFLTNSKDDVRGNGWLSRFLVCEPISNCGYRTTNGVEYSRDSIKKFNHRVEQLLTETSELSDYTQKKVIKFNDEAKSILIDIYNDIELKMRPGGIYFNAKDHASKLLENIARVAAILHCFENSFDEDIPAATLHEAINLVAYCSGQFMKVFCAPPKYAADAEALFYWFCNLLNSGVRYIKRNCLLQRGPVRNKKDLGTALDYLQLNNPFGELTAGRTKVIDLLPQYLHDEVKLANDLKLNIHFN